MEQDAQLPRLAAALELCSTASSTSARRAASAALTLKNSAWRPSRRTSAAIRSAFGSVALRSRWTPTIDMPASASASAVASPNPDDAPRISAQPDRRIGESSGPWVISAPPRGSGMDVAAWLF